MTSILRTRDRLAGALYIKPAALRRAVAHNHPNCVPDAGSLHNRTTLDLLPENAILIGLLRTLTSGPLWFLPVAQRVTVTDKTDRLVNATKLRSMVNMSLFKQD